MIHRKLTYLTFALLVMLSTISVLNAQEWKKAEAPLETVWASKVDTDSVLPEYPRPILQRKDWMNLNGIWEFQEAELSDRVPFKTLLDEKILVPYPIESAMSGVRRQLKNHRAWYRRTFDIPKDKAWKDKEFILHFGAVDYEAVVYVNGRCAGQHKGGYDAFSFNITSFLEEEGEQELIVHIYDPGNIEGIAIGKQNNERFSDPQRYTYSSSSGIWQTVWIEPVSKSYIKDLHITNDIDHKTITVKAIPESQRNSHDVFVAVKEEGRIVATARGKVNRDIELAIQYPKLWSPDAPFLYDVELILMDSNKVLDRIQSYTGMRKIALGEGVKGLKVIELNNKAIFQMGPLDQGYWPDGIYTAPTDEALKWDVAQIKEFGYNMIRKHIKIEPQRWYYWCDKLGILVWQDMPNTFKQRTEEEKTLFEVELQEMVKEHWNHPSIINWVVFNEHWGIYDPVRLTEMVMALDSHRLVTGNSGIDAGKPNIDYEVGHIKDNHSYRPPNVPFVTQKRASVCGEYGAIGYKVKGHIWDVDGPWVHHNYKGLEDATSEYEKFIQQIVDFKKEGLSAAVYTQWTDVENEMNGIYTYDRKVIKLDKERVKRANLSTYQKTDKPL